MRRPAPQQTGVVLDAGIGVDTTYPGYGSWHGVSPLVEIVTNNDPTEHCPVPNMLSVLT